MTWGDPCIVKRGLNPEDIIKFSVEDHSDEIGDILSEEPDTEKATLSLVDWIRETVSDSITMNKDDMAELLNNNLDGGILLDVIHDLVSDRTTKKQVANWLFDHGLATADTPHPALVKN